MKVAEILLGTALLASGVLGPAVTSSTGPFTGEVHTEATFIAANYTGEAQVSSEQALVRTNGSYELRGEAEEVTITVHRYEKVNPEIDGPVVALNAGAKTEETVIRETHRNASLRLAGTSQALLYAWTGSKADSRFQLDLDPSLRPTITASANGMRLASDDSAYVKELDGPLFSISHEGAWERFPDVQTGRFASFGALGGIDLVVEETFIHLEDAEGEVTYDTASWDDPDGGELPSATTKETYAFLSIEGANLSLDYDSLGPGSQSQFFGKDTTWAINGTLEMDAQKGSLSYGEQNRSLVNDTVLIPGNTTLSLEPLGQDDEVEPLERLGGDIRLYRQVLPHPTIEGEADSQVEWIQINGDTVEVPQPPPVPEEVTFFGKLLGILVLVYSVGRKLAVFGIGLLAREPLDHPKRRQIYGFLCEERIAYLREIKREVGFPTATTAYHLNVLEEHDVVGSIERGGYKAFFPLSNDFCWEEMERLALLADPTRRRIGEILLEEGTASQKILARRLERDISSVSRQLSKLADAGLVQRRGERFSEYSPGQLLVEWLSSGGEQA